MSQQFDNNNMQDVDMEGIEETTRNELMSRMTKRLNKYRTSSKESKNSFRKDLNESPRR